MLKTKISVSIRYVVQCNKDTSRKFMIKIKLCNYLHTEEWYTKNKINKLLICINSWKSYITSNFIDFVRGRGGFSIQNVNPKNMNLCAIFFIVFKLWMFILTPE